MLQPLHFASCAEEVWQLCHGVACSAAPVSIHTSPQMCRQLCRLLRSPLDRHAKSQSSQQLPTNIIATKRREVDPCVAFCARLVAAIRVGLSFTSIFVATLSGALFSKRFCCLDPELIFILPRATSSLHMLPGSLYLSGSFWTLRPGSLDTS